MTADAPAATKPLAKLSMRCCATAERPFRQPRLGQAAGVAEVVQQHDRVLRELDRGGDPPLPEVLMRVVAAPRGRVEAEAVLGRRVERVAVRAGPAVAMAHVDDQRRALERGLDRRPRGVGGVDLGHVGRVLPGDRGGGSGLGAIAVRGGAGGPDDRARPLGRGRSGRRSLPARRSPPTRGRRRRRAPQGSNRAVSRSTATSANSLHLSVAGRERTSVRRAKTILPFPKSVPICRFCAPTPVHPDTSPGTDAVRHTGTYAEPPRRRDEPVPAPARPQPGRLVPVGRRRARPGEAARPADLPLDRLRGLPLVPRHGARVVRGRGHRGATSTTSSWRSRWTARSAPTSTSSTWRAVQAMTGQGGWPMSVFLTPDGRPFYGGTYFPDEPRHGMPSFRQVLEGVARAWREQRDEVESARVAAGVDPRRAAADRGGGCRRRPDARAPRRRPRRALRGSFDRGQRRLGRRARSSRSR